MGCGEEVVCGVDFFRVRYLANGQGGYDPIPDEDHTAHVSYVFLCDECGDRVMEHFVAMNEDVRPVPAPPRLRDSVVRDCVACGSDIVEAEAAYVQREVSVSRIRRRGNVGLEVRDPEVSAFCLCCIQDLSDLLESEEIFENGERETVLQTDECGECSSCTQSRCWRPTTTCGCRCHTL